MLQLVTALGTDASVHLPVFAEDTTDPATVLHEGVLLAGAGLEDLDDVDPDLRPALLVAASSVATGHREAP